MKQVNDKQLTPKRKLNSGSVKGLFVLLETGLTNMYWSEQAFIKTLQKLIKSASAGGLTDALSIHHEISRQHVSRLEEVFRYTGIGKEAKECDAMKGLLHESELSLKLEEGPLRDAAIIDAVQKIQHYAIATYGTLCTFASTLDEQDALGLLEDNLIEEKDADELLSQLAASGIHIEKAVDTQKKQDQ